MCGRYVRRGDKQRIADAMRAEVWFEVFPSYNVAPGSFQPVIMQNDEGCREARMMWWGLIPFWAKDKKVGYSTINAMCETVASKPAFRESLKKRRCLVPADAFYEWQKIDAKTKQAYAFGLKDDAMFAFAGLWERWKDIEKGETLESFTIVTTDPNAVTEKVHSRMPVILKPDAYARWLDPGNPQQPPVDLLRPYDAEAMKAWKVDAKVGNVRNNEPSLIEDMQENQEALF